MVALCFKYTSIGYKYTSLDVALYTAKWKTRNAVCDCQFALQEIVINITPILGKYMRKIFTLTGKHFLRILLYCS
jgi:hypothetical protein